MTIVLRRELVFVVIACAGSFGFFYLRETLFSYRVVTATVGAALVIIEALVRPPVGFMDVKLGSFPEDPTLEVVLSRSGLECPRSCDGLLSRRIPAPKARELSRRDLANAVEAATSLEFDVGYCGNGVSMRIPPTPIFAAFR